MIYIFVRESRERDNREKREFDIEKQLTIVYHHIAEYVVHQP